MPKIADIPTVTSARRLMQQPAGERAVGIPRGEGNARFGERAAHQLVWAGELKRVRAEAKAEASREAVDAVLRAHETASKVWRPRLQLALELARSALHEACKPRASTSETLAKLEVCKAIEDELIKLERCAGCVPDRSRASDDMFFRHHIRDNLN